MSFLNVDILWHLLWILPLAVIIFWLIQRKRSRLLKMLLGPRAADPEYVMVSKGARLTRLFIFLAAIIFLALAAARPSWGVKILPFSGKGRDIMVVMDVSRSMLAKDVKPSRLDHAKWFLHQVIEHTPGDRYGLIAFAGKAYLECPMTIDKTSFFQVLDELKTDSVPIGGTDIEAALKGALEAFRDAKSGQYKAVLLITDGDELYGRSSAVVSKLKEMKIPLFIVGVGDPSKPGLVPVQNENGKVKYLRDSKGELVKSRLNEAQLSKLAIDTNGIYVRSTATDTGLAQIEKSIDGLAPKEFDSGKHTRKIERFYYPLWIAVILLFIWMSISERGRKNGVSGSRKGQLMKALVVILVAVILLGAGSVYAQGKSISLPVKNIPVSLNKIGKVDPAKEEAKKDIPQLTDPVTVYNQGLDLHVKQKKTKDAEKLYLQAVNLAKDNPEVRANAFQNLGTIKHEMARKGLGEASGVARQNLDGALKKIDEVMKELDKSEEMYCEAMRQKDSTVVARNQQLLLNDRKKAEQLKKAIQEMKKKQEEARKKTQQAKQQQQKENKQQKQQKQDKKDQQKQQQQQQQDQQKQQDKQQQQNKDKQQQQQQKQDQNKDKQQDKNKQDKKDQQKQDQKQQQNKDKDQQQNQQQQNKQQQQKQQNKQQQKDQQQSAKEKTQQAQKAVDDMKKQAEKLKNDKIKQQAQKAEQELKKASKAQKENKGKEAEEHLKKALEKLGEPKNDKQQDKNQKKSQDNKNKKDNKDNKDQKDKQKQDKDKGDKQKDKQQDRKLEKNKAQKAQGEKGKKAEKDIDKQQAKALLDLMAKEEKSLRKAIKERQKENSGIKDVEKDW
jgi:Ca-activated chloride channel family protein